MLTLVLGQLCAACGGGEATSPVPTEVVPSHVLLISLDSTRRDLLSTYGHVPKHAPRLATSPAIDRLAAEGVLFEEAYATTSWTLPSHWSLLTGVPELVHGVDLDHLRPNLDLPTMAERLGDLGFSTVGFFSGPYLDPSFGFERGFDRYQAIWGGELSDASQRAKRLRVQLASARALGNPRRVQRLEADLAAAERQLEVASHRDVSSARVADEVIAEFEEAARSGRSLFVFAHFFDPHYDHVAPEPFGSAFDPDYPGQDPGSGGRWPDFLRNPSLSRLEMRGGTEVRLRVASDRALENVWAGYEGEMAWTDAALGRVFDRLEELGLKEDTLVVLVSDHGDEFFEHGDLGHRRTLFEEVTAVPLIFSWPRGLPAGVRVAGTTSLLQVLPTMLDCLGAPLEWGVGAKGAHPQGGPWNSLRPRIEAARAGEETPDAPVLGRLVRSSPAQLTLRGAEGVAVEVVGVQRVEVQETWRRGNLKLLRRATWLVPDADLSNQAAARVRRERGRGSRSEELLWIDLGLHPSEQIDAYSADWSDPRALQALEDFAAEYEILLQRRQTPQTATEGLPGPGPSSVELEALGYAQAGESPGRFLAEALLLPAPKGP